MQSVKELLDINKVKTHFAHQPMKNQHQPTLSRSTNSGRKRIDMFFSKFAVYYGHVWRNQFKNDAFMEFAKTEWLDALKSFDDEVLGKAILECRDFCELPPTMPKFIKNCRDIKKRYAVEEKKEYKRASVEVAQMHLKLCKNFNK